MTQPTIDPEPTTSESPSASSAITDLAKPDGGSARRTRSEPKWTTDAKDRVRAHIRRMTKPMQEMLARDANEGDTRFMVTDFLTDAFGFDKYEDLTTEYQVKGEFADYGIRIDRQLVAFVEVKRISQQLNERHLRQVQMYAVNEGVEWLLLTNGRVWQVWHLTGGLPVALDLVMEVDILGAGSTPKTVADLLWHLCKDALRRRTIEDVWRARAATAPKKLAEVIMTDNVIAEIRRELRRQTGYNAEPADLAKFTKDTVILPGLLD
jgi:hypothetical protein